MTINILITGISGQDGLYLTKNLLESKKNVNIFDFQGLLKRICFFLDCLLYQTILIKIKLKFFH